MRKLYNEFFYIPKHGKVREKVMMTRLVSTIAIVIMCLAAMSITAYAYFSYNITSGSNIIKAAHFETKVSIQITDENGEAVDINPITSNYQTHKVTLNAGELYTITVTPTENSTATTGFIVVTADGCDKTYHTQQLGIDESVADGKTPSITFKLLITDTTEVKFLAHWGTSSYYDDYKNKGDSEELYITQNEEVKMLVNGFEEPNVTKEDVSTDVSETTEVTTGTETTGTTDVTTTTPPAESTISSATQTNPPATETLVPSTTTPESTGTSEPTTTTEPATNETTTPSEQTEPQVTTETQSTEESVDTPTTETSE